MANSSVFTISSGAQSKLPRSQNLLHGITGNWMKGVCTYGGEVGKSGVCSTQSNKLRGAEITVKTMMTGYYTRSLMKRGRGSSGQPLTDCSVYHLMTTL